MLLGRAGSNALVGDAEAGKPPLAVLKFMAHKSAKCSLDVAIRLTQSSILSRGEVPCGISKAAWTNRKMLNAGRRLRGRHRRGREPRVRLEL